MSLAHAAHVMHDSVEVVLTTQRLGQHATRSETRGGKKRFHVEARDGEVHLVDQLSLGHAVKLKSLQLNNKQRWRTPESKSFSKNNYDT